MLWINIRPGFFILRITYTITGFSKKDCTHPAIDAERMYCALNECILYGKLEYYDDSDLRTSDYYYYFSPDSLDAISGSLLNWIHSS